MCAVPTAPAGIQRAEVGVDGRGRRARGGERGWRALMPPTLLMRMRKIQVLSDERPSNAHMPWITPTQVSGTTSSATARLEM
jgi:hypothetical protein